MQHIILFHIRSIRFSQIKILFKIFRIIHVKKLMNFSSYVQCSYLYKEKILKNSSNCK